MGEQREAIGRTLPGRHTHASEAEKLTTLSRLSSRESSRLQLKDLVETQYLEVKVDEKRRLSQ